MTGKPAVTIAVLQLIWRAFRDVSVTNQLLPRQAAFPFSVRSRMAPQRDQADSTCWPGTCLTEIGPHTLLSSTSGESQSTPERKGQT